MSSPTLTSSVDSPVRRIELAVLQRALDEQLDVDNSVVQPRLIRLIDEEIAAWHRDYRHGRHAHGLADATTLRDRVVRNLLAYGPLQALLDDDDVWEIMINAPDQIFARRHRGPSGYHHEAFHDRDHVLRTLTRMLHDASASHRRLEPSQGLQDAQLDSGARLHIVHSDIGRDGHLLVNVRKFTGVGFRSLDELVARGTLTASVRDFLAAAVAARLSIVIAGAPGAGKTTLLSCCLAELDPRLRVVTAEEVFEVDVPLPNVASMQTRAQRAERPAIDLHRLVAGFLRMAPDVAVVGEVRDQEALPFLLTVSSGVTGLTTIHAASAQQALPRLRLLAQLSTSRANLSPAAVDGLVGSSVDLVVHCRRADDGPVVSEIATVETSTDGSNGETHGVNVLYRRDQTQPSSAYGAGWTGRLPRRAESCLRAAGWRPVAVAPTAATTSSQQADGAVT